jgi:hypothetical protein
MTFIFSDLELLFYFLSPQEMSFEMTFDMSNLKSFLTILRKGFSTMVIKVLTKFKKVLLQC